MLVVSDGVIRDNLVSRSGEDGMNGGDGTGEDGLGERVDSRRTVAAQHVRQRDLRVSFRNPGGVEVDRGAPVGRLDAAASLDLLEDRLRDRVARSERVRELLLLCV